MSPFYVRNFLSLESIFTIWMEVFSLCGVRNNIYTNIDLFNLRSGFEILVRRRLSGLKQQHHQHAAMKAKRATNRRGIIFVTFSFDNSAEEVQCWDTTELEPNHSLIISTKADNFTFSMRIQFQIVADLSR